ncbi:MAG: carbohydrate porin [Segetibacter sp.]
MNQVADRIPTKRITIRAGKFGMSDFFDNNTYSKDPRTQFFNWSLWANGAWDYPADTRGYTYGVVAELVKPTWSLRLSSVAVPRIANFHLLEYNLSKAHSETVEVDHKFSLINQPGKVRFTVSNTYSQAPSYSEGLKALRNNNIFLLNVIQGNEEHKVYGGRKVSLGLNVEQQINNELGFFSRAGWNDGKYVTWAFTEIDRTINAGFSVKGIKWKRPDDVFGVAAAINGISKEHREFLKSGGYGFIIGDGTLNYGNEGILETYYRAQLGAMFSITFDYEFVNHPAYNKDRGPVNAFGIRGHVQF